MFHLDASDIPALQRYLNSRSGSGEEEIVLSAEKPGDGNMNYVLRIHLGVHSYIIKQARPYVEKYPQIAAPVERAIIEAAFYKVIQEDEVLKSYTPLLLWTDEINYIIALEDLGQASDYSDLYSLHKKLSLAEANELVAFINRLQNMPKTKNPLFQNHAMKKLNHQHIFLYPFMEDNGFDLDKIQPGLQSLAMKYKTDTRLKENIHSLGEIYLQDGNSLVHGDFYPGSWLHTDKGIKVIDPEFCFYGPSVFDPAIMTAHCLMTQQDQRIIESIYVSNQQAADFDRSLYNRFTGVEIMRRVIGLAQVPLILSLEAKERLLNKAAALLLD